MGLSDVPNVKPVKLYCARCEDIYNPKSSRHASIDGAYFGTSFHNILFQVYPTLVPPKSAERYIPRVYGFKVHAAAALIRWQTARQAEMRRRLRKMDVDSGFRDDIPGNGVDAGGGAGGGLDDDDEEDEDLDGPDYAPEQSTLAGPGNDNDSMQLQPSPYGHHQPPISVRAEDDDQAMNTGP